MRNLSQILLNYLTKSLTKKTLFLVTKGNLEHKREHDF